MLPNPTQHRTDECCMFCAEPPRDYPLIWPCICGKAHADCASKMLSIYQPIPLNCLRCGKPYKIRYHSEIVCSKLICDKKLRNTLLISLGSALLVICSLTMLYYNINVGISWGKLVLFVGFVVTSLLGYFMCFCGLNMIRKIMFLEKELIEIEGYTNIERCKDMKRITEESIPLQKNEVKMFYSPQTPKPTEKVVQISRFKRSCANATEVNQNVSIIM